nr:MAG TPA: hypothetical protein [Caudoviricetes sp.]
MKPYAREEPPFKEAGCLKPGARQMGGQERRKHEDTCGM